MLADGAALILLDERGKTPDSPGFANLAGSAARRWPPRSGHRHRRPDGLDPDLHARADAVICFGRMTWPHQLVRIMAAEQLYRAVTDSVRPSLPPGMTAACWRRTAGFRRGMKGSQRIDPPRHHGSWSLNAEFARVMQCAAPDPHRQRPAQHALCEIVAHL
jgi:hypothetical protein